MFGNVEVTVRYQEAVLGKKVETHVWSSAEARGNESYVSLRETSQGECEQSETRPQGRHEMSTFKGQAGHRACWEEPWPSS